MPNYDQMAAECPYLGSDVRPVLEQGGCGWVVLSDKSDRYAACILSMYAGGI
jgi:hypothetical protein